MPFSVLKSSGAAVGGPRNQPTRPGFPADGRRDDLVDEHLEVRPHEAAGWRRRPCRPEGAWFFSGGPSASMRRWSDVRGVVRPELDARRRRRRPGRSCLWTAGTLVVVGAVDVVVSGTRGRGRRFLVAAAVAGGAREEHSGRARDGRPAAGRIWVMTAQGSHGGGGRAVIPGSLRRDGRVPHPRVDRRPRSRRPGSGRAGRGAAHDPADRDRERKRRRLLLPRARRRGDCGSGRARRSQPTSPSSRPGRSPPPSAAAS